MVRDCRLGILKTQIQGTRRGGLGLGFRILRFRVEDLGFRVNPKPYTLNPLGFRGERLSAWGLEFRTSVRSMVSKAKG